MLRKQFHKALLQSRLRTRAGTEVKIVPRLACSKASLLFPKRLIVELDTVNVIFPQNSEGNCLLSSGQRCFSVFCQPKNVSLEYGNSPYKISWVRVPVAAQQVKDPA